MSPEAFLREQRELDAEFARMPHECARMIAALMAALDEQDNTIKTLLAVNQKLLDRPEL